jgi:hypothetical protein
MKVAAGKASLPISGRFRAFFDSQKRRSADTEAEITRLSNLIQTISQRFFHHLVDLQIELLIQTSPSTPTSEDKERWRKRVEENFHSELARNMLKYMPEGYAPKQGIGNNPTAEAVQMYFHKNVKRFIHFTDFEDILDMIFSRGKKEIKSLARLLDKDIIKCIAWAIQDIVIETPDTFYKYNDIRVSENDEKRLIDILKDIESIRVNHHILSTTSKATTPTSLRDLTSAVRELKLETAQVNKMTWLPLRSFVTAPLAEEDLLFYIENSADAESLARRMVINDGVILITGYRGVGKSTFINMVLSKLPEVQQEQVEDVPWHVMPISISLAKATSVSSVLRLCVRALYNTLIAKPFEKGEKTSSHILLSKDEQKHIRWANLRATYKVNMQQGESVGTLKRLQAGLDVKLADLVPQTIGGITLGPLLPTFGFHSSKEWNKKVDRTVALFDYDEDRAEEDIVSLIKMLATPRMNAQGKKVRIKLAFIFDEMDKMDEKEGQLPLIQQLKNLFLTRHVIFLLVTSKEFYYLCLTDQKREDALLSGYFSSVMMIPLFTAKQTTDLVKRLIWMPPDQLASQDVFVQSLARYLTYRAKGVPREVVRQLQEMQKWVPNSLQPYITDRQIQSFTIQVYARIQEVLEKLVESEASVGTVVPAASNTASTSEVSVAPERLWMNEERRDQSRRGLYVLVEELLDRTSLEIVELGPDGKVPEPDRKDDPDGEPVMDASGTSPDGRVLERILESNFRMALPFRFNELVKQLADSLQNISIESDKIFSLEEQGQFPKLTVSKVFYDLTGRSATAPPKPVDQSNALTLEDIHDRLSQKSINRQRRALNELQQLAVQNQNLPSDISTQLFRIFITPGEEFRSEASRYLSGSAFFENAEKEQGLLKRFIALETNEQLLREFIRLIDEGATDNEKRRKGIENLLELLESRTPLPVSKSILIEAISRLVESTNEDVLTRVMKSLDARQDISKDVLTPLKKIAAKSGQNLVGLLVTHNFSAISSGTLQDIFGTQTDNDLKNLWSLIIGERPRKLAQEVWIAILQQLPRLEADQNAILEGPVLQWLNLATWNSSIDQDILRKAARRNPRLPDVLERLVDKSGGKLAQERLKLAFPGSVTGPLLAQTKASDSASSSTTTTATTGNRVWNWIIALSILGTIVVYFAVPFDLPTHVTLVGRLMARFLEAVYVYGGVIGIILLIWTAFGETQRGFAFGMAIVSLMIAIACFLIQIFFFPLAFTLVGQLILLSLLVLVPFVLLIILASIVGSSSRATPVR